MFDEADLFEASLMLLAGTTQLRRAAAGQKENGGAEAPPFPLLVDRSV